MFKSHSSQYRSLILNHVYECATSPFLALASLSELIFAKELKFNVTLKGHIKKNIFVSWDLLIPQLVLFIMTILGFGISLNKIFIANSVELKESVIINIIWAGYNLIGIVMIMLLSLKKPRYRRLERRIVDYKSSLIFSDSKVLNCTIHDISDSEIRISINRNKLGNLDVGDIIKVKIGKSEVFCSSVVTGAFPRMDMKESPKPNYIAQNQLLMKIWKKIRITLKMDIMQICRQMCS